jgi:hypothetical protein
VDLPRLNSKSLLHAANFFGHVVDRNIGFVRTLRELRYLQLNRVHPADERRLHLSEPAVAKGEGQRPQGGQTKTVVLER